MFGEGRSFGVEKAPAEGKVGIDDGIPSDPLPAPPRRLENGLAPVREDGSQRQLASGEAMEGEVASVIRLRSGSGPPGLPLDRSCLAGHTGRVADRSLDGDITPEPRDQARRRATTDLHVSVPGGEPGSVDGEARLSGS